MMASGLYALPPDYFVLFIASTGTGRSLSGGGRTLQQKAKAKAVAKADLNTPY